MKMFVRPLPHPFYVKVNENPGSVIAIMCDPNMPRQTPFGEDFALVQYVRGIIALEWVPWSKLVVYPLSEILDSTEGGCMGDPDPQIEQVKGGPEV